MIPFFEEADFAVGHNSTSFDFKKIRTRMIKHGLSPHASCKSYDTLKVAKAIFSFSSNKLQYIANYLGHKGKMETGGFDLWKRIDNGDIKAVHKMVAYNDQDIRVTEFVYDKLKAYDPQHPNMNVINDTEDACPTCGSEHVQYRGYRLTRVNKFHRIKCMNHECGAWFSKPLTGKGKSR